MSNQVQYESCDYKVIGRLCRPLRQAGLKSLMNVIGYIEGFDPSRGYRVVFVGCEGNMIEFYLWKWQMLIEPMRFMWYLCDITNELKALLQEEDADEQLLDDYAASDVECTYRFVENLQDQER